MRLKDKVIIVTGGANGLGKGYCERFVQEGASVVIADLDLAHGEALAEQLNQSAGAKRAVATRTDVTSQSSTEEMAAVAVKEFGKIDVLINNAGTYPHVDFDDITYDAWRKVITVNLDSVFLCVKAVLPQMKQQKSSKIINVATDLIWVGLAGMVHYVSAKSGLIGFTRSLAQELGPLGITVNAMAPGAVMPPLDRISAHSRGRFEAIINFQAIRRPLKADDLVGPMVFLASEDSDFISGQILSVDGGLTTH